MRAAPLRLRFPPQNVLLTANGAVRLADVGFSRLKDKTFLSHGAPGRRRGDTVPSLLCKKAQCLLLQSNGGYGPGLRLPLLPLHRAQRAGPTPALVSPPRPLVQCHS